MSKKFFWGKKYVLSSGREIDISSEEETQGVVSSLAILNHLDSVHEITKPISIRMQWDSPNSDPVLSIECRGGAPGDTRPVSESEMPVEGLNGHKDKLKASELIELFDVMNKVHQKIRKELNQTAV
ncbi:MAG: hypothetical protein ACK481_05960 [Candidatus Melainabacteria bacterium]|jgi:hypothetical protein